MTMEWVARLTAWLVALYAVDVVVPIIDIFALPLPRYVGSMSLSIVFILAALGLLVPLAKLRHVRLVGIGVMGIVGILLFWASLEVIAALGGGTLRFDLIVDFVPLVLVLVVSRLHFELFGNRRLLVIALVLTASSLVLLQSVLLVGLLQGIPLTFVNIDELRGRNATALLGPVCLWMLTFLPVHGWAVPGRRYGALLLLSLVSIVLSEARAGLLILVWCILVGLALHSHVLRRWLSVSMLPAGVVIVVVAALAHPILNILGDQGVFLMGRGDDALSMLARSTSNFMLLQKLMEAPLTGIGWDAVADTKAFGYMGHTLYVNALAAYGVIGAIPVVLLIAQRLRRLHGAAKEIAGHLLLLALMIASVSNNVFAYFGVALALIGAKRMPNVTPSTETHEPETPHAAC